MIDLEKLETNVFEIINILSDNELLKQEKFKNIYQINEKISSNFNYFLDSLKFRKIKNLDEVKIKFNENLKYFKNFSFIQKKINLIVLNNLSIEKKKKLNNQFLDEIILYFNQKKYEINAIIYLGYQKIEKVDKLVDEIDFLNENIESNFEIFNKNIQNFNNLEKNNSINFYTEISKNSSKNNFVQEKLKKINKKFFFHDEYLSLKKEIDFRLDENIQSDANSADSAVNIKEVELFNNFPKIKLEMENLKNELNQLAEASEIYDDKNLVNFSDLLDALKNINIREILKSNETFEIIFFKNSESDEHEKIIFNFSDNWQSIEDKFHLYFNKMTNYVRRYALKNLRDVYIFTTKFIEVNNKFSNLAKSNLINFKKTSDKDFLKLEYLKNLQGVKLYDNVWFDSGIETFLVQNGLDNNTFFDSEEFRKNFNLLRARLFEKTEIKSLPSDSFEKLELINSSLKNTYSEGSKKNFNKVEPGKHFLDIIKKSVQESKNSFFEWDGKSFINFFSLIFNNNKFDKEIAKEFLEKKSFQEIKDLIINLNNQKIVKIFNWFKDYYANLTENKYKYFNKIKNFFADSEIEEEIRTNKNLSKIMKDYNSLPYGAVNIFGLLKSTFLLKKN
ncbi:hypothetical protein JTY60_02030 [symbiont of Argiope bruennichi]|uniref:hypothetical protein n=1 Tax=symbiont of Argiope bruennichi TaxID=2810479 RepID=UPI003DA33193